MMDSELRLLLKNEYGFKDHHLLLLEYFFEKRGKKIVAEELWNKTTVPKGRIYDFLNDLVDWGFLEVTRTKPRAYQLQNLKDALQSAIRQKERALSDAEQRTVEVVNRMEQAWQGETVKAGKVELISGAQEWYLKLKEVSTDTLHVKIAARTPSLLLVSERNTTWRRRFYELLHDRLSAGRVEAQCVFSLPAVVERVAAREHKEDVLKSVENLRKMKHLTLKYVETPYIPSMMLTKESALLGFPGVQGEVNMTMYTTQPETVEALHRTYDTLFLDATAVEKDLIQRLGMV